MKFDVFISATNGKLYAPPIDASQVLEVDPATGTTRLIGDEMPGQCEYRALTGASNGKLYAAPADASHVLEVDPKMGTTRLVGDELRGFHKYSSMTAADNGKLYAPPVKASRARKVIYESPLGKGMAGRGDLPGASASFDQAGALVEAA